MRLEGYELGHIIDCVHAQDPLAEVFLYGSRTDTSAKGGDIDLLIISEKLSFTDKLDILICIKEKIGQQKIDLTIQTPDALAQNIFFQTIKSSLRKISR